MRSLFALAILAAAVACGMSGCATPSTSSEVPSAAGGPARPFGLPTQWKDPDLGHAIVKGAARGDVLWLLGSSGALVEFDLRRDRRRIVKTGVRTMLLDGPHLWAVSAGGARSSWIVQDVLRSAAAEDVRAAGEVVDLFKAGARLGVLTESSVSIRGPSGWEPLGISPPLQRGRVSVMGTPAGLLYVGRTKGEWGGELSVLDLATGKVEELAKHHVNALSPDPASPPCLMAAFGLAHMGMSSGGVMRVCGRQAPTEVLRVPISQEENLFGGNRPFRDVAATPKGWLAFSDDRLFKSRDGRTTEVPMPALRPRAGIWLNDDDPDLILVVNACCWGVADNPTDYGVILVPRQRP